MSIIKNELPLEMQSRPVRSKVITIQETLQTWVTWPEENLLGILWIIARLRYTKMYTWFTLDITKGLSKPKLLQLTLAFKKKVYFSGVDSDQFDILPTIKEGICFSWIGLIDLEFIERRKRQRRARHSIAQRAEGHAAPSVAITQPLPIETPVIPEISDAVPYYMRPRKPTSQK